MPVPQCRDCGANLEYIPAPNGGQIPCNFAPGYIVPGAAGEQGAGAVGYEPRHLRRIEGQLVDPLEAAARITAGDRSIMQVWLPHAPRCPRRPREAPPDVQARTPVQVEETPRLF